MEWSPDHQELEDWKSMGVEGHFHAKTPWFDYHKTLTKNVAPRKSESKHFISDTGFVWTTVTLCQIHSC